MACTLTRRWGDPKSEGQLCPRAAAGLGLGAYRAGLETASWQPGHVLFGLIIFSMPLSQASSR